MFKIYKSRENMKFQIGKLSQIYGDLSKTGRCHMYAGLLSILKLKDHSMTCSKQDMIYEVGLYVIFS